MITQKDIVGDKLRTARERAGLSAAALGERIGVSGNTIYRWERGELAPPIDRLEAVASATGHELQIEFAPRNLGSVDLTPIREAATVGVSYLARTLFVIRHGRRHDLRGDRTELAAIQRPLQAEHGESVSSSVAMEIIESTLAHG